MRSIEVSAKTVDDAVSQALHELQVDKDRVQIEVLEEAQKGLFGLLGVKMARVKVTISDTPAKMAREFLEKVFKNINVTVVIEETITEDYVYFSFAGKDLGILIGRRGETLDALQYLTNLVVNRKIEERVRFILDVEGYRKRREQTLQNLALKLSDKVKNTGKKVILEPMNPHERRIIHTALQQDNTVHTFSEGEEPYRKVVINLKK
ncbi:protein jag [Metallumcola ferriviriculae]|uniref:RNA-binding protein KhpB n=1 Tax=Metallumcola ferriviriculae TaxID=3039180 RepID=A0AAU0UK74_9FIRM|nr:protein jag [Desulfitibacteraceae bacterium MK1]